MAAAGGIQIQRAMVGLRGVAHAPQIGLGDTAAHAHAAARTQLVHHS